MLDYVLASIIAFIPSGEGTDPVGDKKNPVVIKLDERFGSLHSCLEAFHTHKQIARIRAGHDGIAVIGDPCIPVKSGAGAKGRP